MRKVLHLVRGVAVVISSFLLLAATPLHAAVPLHIELESAVPAAGGRVAEPPASLRLRFSAFIEPAYTSVSLTAPDGQRVVTGRVAFIDGSDREFTVPLPPLTQAGEYTVAWRTAGADGHVIEGSYSFTVETGDEIGDDAAAGDVAADPPSTDATSPAADEHADMHEHGGTSSSEGPLAVIARLLHFVALVAMLGAASFRVLLLPRLAADAGPRLAMQRGAWRALAFAAVVLGVAVVMRLWLQSTALHGADRAWSTPLLSMMLTDTSWGRAWVLQAFLFVVLGAGIAWARPPRDRIALAVAVPAVLGLAAMPAISGHAAGAAGSAYLAVFNDAIHVIAAGAWLGTLLMLAVVAVPTLLRAPAASPGGAPDGAAAATPPAHARVAASARVAANGAAAADAVRRFSPIALAAAAIVLATGLINSLLHINALNELVTTPYGRVLLAKITLVGLVLLAGLVNWKFITPRLDSADGMRKLRLSAAAELSVALLVLIATAVLTGTPRP